LEAAEALSAIRQYLSRHSADEFVADSGSQFKNAEVEQLMKENNIVLKYTLPYSKEENGIVERMNKEVMRHLRAFVYERRVRDTWHDYLYVVQRIINAIPHRVTRIAPADLHYGAHHKAKDSQFFIADPVTGEVRLTETAEEFNLASRKYHETLINIAAEYQLAENERSIERRSSPDNVQYEIGDYVLLSPHRGLGSARRAKDKLTTQWQGPYKIVAILGNTITVSSINEDSFQDVNIREIKIFRESSSSSAASMETIAALDKNEYMVAT
jgi:hypothetical protein